MRPNTDHLVLLTSRTEQEHTLHCKHCGCDETIRLPMSIDAYCRLLDRFQADHRTCTAPVAAPARAGEPCCARCGRPLDNLSPGWSVTYGGAKVCTPCLRPGEEMLRAK